MAGVAGHGADWQGSDWLGQAGVEWIGSAWNGQSRQEWRGRAGPDRTPARQGEAGDAMD